MDFLAILEFGDNRTLAIPVAFRDFPLWQIAPARDFKVGHKRCTQLRVHKRDGSLAIVDDRNFGAE